jgi:mono/diheme cytochrome c family protein
MMRLASALLLLAVLPTVAAFASEQKAKTSEAPPSGQLYEVKDGNKVDAKTLEGWKTWRAMACERCHGPAQEGLVGPSLIEAFKTITKERFHEQLMKGSPEKGMPPFAAVEMVNKNWEALYAYLKGRSDGAIQPGRLTAIEPTPPKP